MADFGSEARSGGRDPESVRSGPLFVPVTDICETEEAHLLILEMPGVAPDSLHVTLDQQVLTVSGVSRTVAPEGYALTHQEYQDGEFERAFAISEGIDSERIEAELRDGLLRLRLPKSKPAPAKSIHVKGEG
jgi:HSP20 family protein